MYAYNCIKIFQFPSNSVRSTCSINVNLLRKFQIDRFPNYQVRLKLWKTPSREQVCEVQPLEGNSTAQRYTQQQQRRYSDFAVAGSMPPPTGSIRRRASEMPKLPTSSPGQITPAAGIVCSNTDLISILSSLTSSASEINRCGIDEAAVFPSTSGGKIEKPEVTTGKTAVEQKRNRLKGFRSNSFDVSILHGTGNKTQSLTSPKNSSAPTSWFVKRHQPMSKKQKSEDSAPTAVTFRDEKSTVVKIFDPLQIKPTKLSPTSRETGPAVANARHKVVWDDKSGTKVDAQVLGSAIEGFLTAQRGGELETPSSSKSGNSPNKPRSSPSKVANWFSGANKEDEQTESCEPSICSTLKDLFVK